MNYIREAEDVLNNYRKLKSSIDNLERRKQIILNKGKPRELGAIDYSKPVVSNKGYTDDTLNQICEITQINSQIKDTEAEINVITKILREIRKENEILAKFLILRHIERKDLRTISKDLGYSEESNHTIYDIKNKAIREFAIRYFGSQAMRYT